MHPRHRALVLSTALLALLAPPAYADVVADWIELGQAQNPPPSPTRPDQAESPWTLTSESDTVVAVAVFQAVNTIERRYAPYRQGLVAPAGPASAPAAAVAAAHAALLTLFPGAKGALDDAYAISLGSIPPGEERQRGVEVGERAAAQVIDWRNAVHPGKVPPQRPLAPPGTWVPANVSSVSPFYFAMQPWTLASADQFRPGPPPELKSAAWAADYNEVKAIGGVDSTTRTPDQAREARFWYLHRWTRTLRQIADRPGRSLAQNARLYAMVAMVSEDVGVTVVDGKFHYLRWRPITAIRNGDQDGNDATVLQADWLPLIPTPAHPEYPCGHCVDSNAIATILDAEGPAPGGVDIDSEAFPNVVMHVGSYREMAERISVSRIWAGAHYRSSVEVGSAIGRSLAEHALRNYLLPVN